MEGGGLGVIANGLVLTEGKTIRYVGPMKPIPVGYRVIDARGKIVMPGLVDSLTHVGLVEIVASPETNDGEPRRAIFPQVRVIDAFNLSSRALKKTRIAGITTILSAPNGRNPISGRSLLVKTTGEANIDKIVVKRIVALHLNLGDPPKTLQRRSDPKTAKTRMGVVAMLREVFVRAQAYRRLAALAKSGPRRHQFKRNLALEVLARVLERKLPVIIRAHRADDILTARRLAKEFGFRWILRGAAEAYKVAKFLKVDHVPVLLGPIRLRLADLETRRARLDNAAILYKAGVRLAIASSEIYNARNLPYEAAFAVAWGLPRVVALRALTIEPARIFGVENRIGSLKRGKDADIVVFSGDPLVLLSRVEYVIVNGRLTDSHPQPE